MDNTQPASVQPADNFMSQLWSKYFPYWPFFGMLLVVFMAIAWYYGKKAAPLYEATATLLIKDEKKGIDDSRMIESLNLLSTKKIVENEIEVLASRSLMEEVVDKLKLYAPVFEVGKWRSGSAYSVSPVRIAVLEPDAIVETPRVEFKFDQARQRVVIGRDSFPLNDWVLTPYGTLKFLPANNRSRITAKPLFFSLVNPKKAVAALMGRLDASPSSKLSTIIYVKLKDEDPLEAEDVLNELIIAYSKAAVNDKNALAANTFSFVQDRLNIIGHHLDSIEHKIQKYKADQGAVDISSQGRMFLENVSSNDRKVGEVNMQLAILKQIEKGITGKENEEGYVPSTLGTTDPILTNLLNKLNETELEKEKLRKTTGENSPLIISLNDQIAKLKPGILENIQNQRKSLEASRTDLSATNNTYSSLLQTIPQKERDLVEISRQQNIENNIYSFLLQKREEAALSNSSTVSDSRIVDRAQASLGPVSPKKNMIYLAAIFGALGCGILVITAKEMFSKSILYRSEIEQFTTTPIVGEIGYERGKGAIVLQEGRTSRVAEQFRKLRASLPFLGIGYRGRKLLVTSTVAGEGKSFIVANLGLSLAMTGKKVVLVEADLSNPSLSEKLNVYEDKGLKGFLKGELEVSEIIKQTKINSQLYILPAGGYSANPSELFVSGKMEPLMTFLEKNYDYVLIDTAPVGAMSDAYLLTHLCDATLYVIRHAVTPKSAIRRLDKSNRVNELKNLAIVFNGVRTRGFSKDSYGTSYDYGFAYNRGKAKKSWLPVFPATSKKST
jgi:tyrosine-protein kinase Etk/Wzc